jgi:hypothetical protein
VTGSSEKGNEPLGSIKGREVVGKLSDWDSPPYS